MIKKVFSLPSNVDYNKIVDLKYSSCYCLTLSSDLESYLEIEGHDNECVDGYSTYLIDLGLLIDDGKVVQERVFRGKLRYNYDSVEPLPPRITTEGYQPSKKELDEVVLEQRNLENMND
ncbi:MAG: hypothetical protein KBT03_13220 [Bacteroidales bacterium]|nr:hypothetical protein [Candidatus Scybalousia scybalohippi]